jgi:predicted dehydrogenase
VTRIKIGQIGVGHAHAAGKMEVYRRSDDYEVVGIVEPDPALREAAEKSPTYQGLKWMTQDDLFSTPGLQAVAVETRVRDLLAAAEACIAAGMHIHLDKPAGASLPQYKRILDLAARKHLLVQMGYMFRYNPGVVLLRDVLRRGWLGEPFEVHAVISKVIAAPERRKLAEFTGGMMFELGCHVIDLVVGILGKPERVTPFVQHAAAHDDGLADNMLAVLSYPRALASVKSSGMEVEGFARRHLVVCGTEGTLHIEPLDAPAVRLALSQPREKYIKGYQNISFEPYRRYVGDAADMARIIRGEKESDFSYDHDLAVQETVLRASGMYRA